MIFELSEQFAITRMCDYLRVTTGGYYEWLNRPVSPRALENQRLLAEIMTIHREVNEIYGSPRMTEALNIRGFACSENRVAKIMKDNNIRAKMERNYKPRQWQPNSKIRKPNLLADHPVPGQPNEVWVADFTYAKVAGNFVYFSTVMDLYTRKILGSSVSKQRNGELILKTIKHAINLAGGEAPEIFHSDRGIEYANHLIGDYLKELGVKQSMSGKGCCYDNAHMESFFHTYKSEFYHHEHFKDLRDFKRKTMSYVDFYNQGRLHSSLGYKSPDQYEKESK